MFDKIWDFITSENRENKLIMRASLIFFLFGIGVLSYYMSKELLIASGIILLAVIIVFVMLRSAEKKEERKENEYIQMLDEVDDGVTGYIAVRPEELEGAPWEVRKKKKKPPEEITEPVKSDTNPSDNKSKEGE
ncbi:MAG: hypothetical protein FWF82_02655 [Oscillospiraceae bacterium]|nr:hypothetical protein [Oscillospiraceae bacterium]